MIGGSKFTFDIEKYGNCNGRGGGNLTVIFSAEKSNFKIETYFYQTSKLRMKVPRNKKTIIHK